jgi:hypothetical protein
MAKGKVAARKRRPYEYDHQYGVTVRSGKARKASRGNTHERGTSSRRAKSKTKKSVKKR